MKGGIYIGLFNVRTGRRKPKAVAFVDYEHWYISLNNLYHIKPDIKGWVTDMAKTLDVKEIYFFGDFSKGSLRDEFTKIRGYSNKIIETGNASAHIQKDFTDFIMLDHIYQEATSRKNEFDVFVIFTGDGHFNSVVSFLKNICKKEVSIYAVKGACSNQLKMTATRWTEYPNDEERMKPYFQMIFTNLDNLLKSGKEKTRPTFIKTVEAVSIYNKVPKEEIRQALQWLVDNKYIKRESEFSQGRKIMKISVDWHAVFRDNLWIPEKK